MPLSDDNQFPAVVSVNHQNKNASSGTWHTFGHIDGQVYVSLDLILNAAAVPAMFKEDLRNYVRNKGFKV